MIINCTPHAINVVREDGTNTTFPASGIVPRCAQSTEYIGELDGVHITRSTFGAVVDLPAPEEGTYYIVSSLVAQAAKGRNDLLVPNEQVRDESGRIIGCRSLASI